MPWHITNERAECSGWAVVKDATGEIVGCHRTEAHAQAQLTALNIAESQDRAESYTPTEAMREEAQRGLEWRDEYERGGTEIGVARARSIINGDIPLETIGRMVSYFARHEVDKEGEGWSPSQDGYPSAGRIAWALWGGDPGKAWANAIWRENRSIDDEDAIITDIDGTLVAQGSRVNQNLIDRLNSSEAHVIVVTARSQSQREATQALLERIGLDYEELYMSPGGNATAYKRETAQRLLENWNIIRAYENNEETAAAYRELGIPTGELGWRFMIAEQISRELSKFD